MGSLQLCLNDTEIFLFVVCFCFVLVFCLFCFVFDFETGSHISQAGLELTTQQRLNFWSSSLYHPSLVFTGIHHHTQFVQGRGSNPGPFACWANMLPTEPHRNWIILRFLRQSIKTYSPGSPRVFLQSSKKEHFFFTPSCLLAMSFCLPIYKLVGLCGWLIQWSTCHRCVNTA